MIGLRYLEHLGEADLAFLAAATGEGPPRDPEQVQRLLRSPRVFEALFGREGEEPMVHATPFLAFAVLVEKVAVDLEHATFVEEWLGPGRTVPVFDTAALREFLAPPRHRLYLAELLTSYTRVASGSIWYRTPRGWRRRRYSELDPLRLAELLELAPEQERPWILRRLGDLGLFLSGVFPEHVATHPLQPRHLRRIGRVLGAEEPPDELALSGAGGVLQLEWMGRRAYRLAELPELASGFGQARRVLNVLTGRHLYARRERWFGSPG